MSTKNEIRDFLVACRGEVTPQQAGLPVVAGERRVPGLGRQEVAVLAGVSTDYYARLERGNLAGASDSVLHAIARALRLDDVQPADADRRCDVVSGDFTAVVAVGMAPCA
jgi:hypothetical protein